MKKHSVPFMNIGSVSLLMTFIVLCLVTFATLSLSGSLSNYRYSQKLADHTTEYYEACNEAEQILANISDNAGFLAILEQGGSEYSFQCKINDRQALLVTITVPNSMENWDGSYEILTWQEINTDTWEGDDSLNLIQ